MTDNALDIVLKLVRDAGGKATWHRIATRLPSYDVPADTDVMEVLRELRTQGLVTPAMEPDGTERWSITPAGEAKLAGAAAPGGPLAAADVARFVAALRGGAIASAQAVMPYMDDGLKLWAILRQALAADASAAYEIAAAGLYLPRSERGPFARELMDDPRPRVREALFRAWTPVQTDVPGKPLPTVPDAELDELLRRGLGDADHAVREAAAALAYVALRGGGLVGELTANVGAPERALRCWALLALGAASDPISRELLEQHLAGEPAEAAAAVRALAQRADGYARWRAALDDERPDVRDAAIHALATVVPRVRDEDLAGLAAATDPALARALDAYRARTAG